MPLTLVPPRQGRSPNWTIRGTVRGNYIHESRGVADRVLAAAFRDQRERGLLGLAPASGLLAVGIAPRLLGRDLGGGLPKHVGRKVH